MLAALALATAAGGLWLAWVARPGHDPTPLPAGPASDPWSNRPAAPPSLPAPAGTEAASAGASAGPIRTDLGYVDGAQLAHRGVPPRPPHSPPRPPSLAPNPGRQLPPRLTSVEAERGPRTPVVISTEVTP